MGESRKGKKYIPQTNAVCITVYQPQGGMIPAEVTAACVNAIQAIVTEHRLLVGVATT